MVEREHGNLVAALGELERVVKTNVSHAAM
jgi:hypothetical protein